MLRQAAEAVLENGRIALNVSEDVELFIKPQNLKRDGCADRVPRIGEAMPERAELAALLIASLPNLLANHHSRYGQIARGQALGADQDVRPQAIDLASEHAAEAAKSGNDLIGDKEDFVALQDWNDPLEIPRGRRYDPSNSHDRLSGKSSDRVSSFPLDECFEVAGKAFCEVRLAFTGQAVLPKVGAIGMQEARQRQVEILVKARNPRHAPGCERDAVIRSGPANNLLLLRPVQSVVIIPGELHGGLVRLGA